MEFETAFQHAVEQAWHHVDFNDGYVDSDTFLALDRDYYADLTYGADTIPGEPDDAGRAIRNRATVIWADDISPNDPDPGEPVDLDAPLTKDELATLDSWGESDTAE